MSQVLVTRIFTVRPTATRKYDIAGKQQFCISPEGLPVACYVPEEENVASHGWNLMLSL